MGWPFPTPEHKPANPEASGEPKPADKTPAELISESINAALQPVMAKIGEFDTRLSAVVEQTKRPEPAPAAPGEPTSIFEDENAAFNQRMTPLLANQLTLMARMNKDEVRREYENKGFGDAWAQFEGEIDTWLNNSPLVDTGGKELRGSKDYIRNTVDMIFGRAAVKAGVRFDGKNNKGFFLESAGGDGGNNPTGPIDDGLTTEQRNAARKWGLSIDDIKKAKSKLVVVQ